MPAAPQPSKTWPEEERRVRLDALLLWWPYAAGSLRSTIEGLIEEAETGVWSAENEAQLLACATATWPARVATRRFAIEYPERLWSLLVLRCLPTTQILLKRLAELEGTVSLAQILASPQADLALHERERLEIELLVPHVYVLLWNEAQSEMREQIEEAKRLREEKREMLAGTGGKGKTTTFDHMMMYGEESL
ncbi:hypothetical protein KBB27_04635 [Patescibacteria group bacterium]|nr:hypothetical protein [Patescibacteria group bacterium]